MTPGISDGTADQQIASYAQRIVALEIERRELASDIKDLKAEAKGRGLSPKLITACVRMLLLEADKRAAALSDHEELDLYLNACGLLSGRGGEDDEIPPREGSHPEPAASGNAPGLGEGGSDAAQGYSADPEAPLDSVSRSGGRNVAVCRDGAGASAEPGRNHGQTYSPEGASDLQTDVRVATGGMPQSEGAQVGFGPRSPGMGAESPGTSSPSGWPRAGLQNQAQGVRLPPAVPDHSRRPGAAGGVAR